MEADLDQIGSVAFLPAAVVAPRTVRGRDVGPDPPLSWEPVEPLRGEPSPGDDEQEAGRSE